MSDEPDRAIGYLSSSRARVDLLARLVDGPSRPADLVESTEASRTTVHRTLADFLDREWVRRIDGDYDTTGLGELALESYRRAQSRFQTLERLAPVLAHVEGVGDLDPEWLETARLEIANEENPQRPIEWYTDRLAVVDGDRFRGISPVVNRQFMSVHAPIVEAGVETELVISESTFRFVRDRYTDELERSIELDTYDLYVGVETPPLGLARYGETIFLGTYDDQGRLTGVLEGDDERLREWANRLYRRFREGATRITSADVEL